MNNFGGQTMIPYPTHVEEEMKKFYETLAEKDKRRYAAVESLKFGRGGMKYIVQVLGCSRRTILRGLKELKGLPQGGGYKKRVRKAGGGRKGYEEQYPDIDEKFLDVLKNYTAGDPMDETVVWTDLRPWQIAKLLEEKHEIVVSKTVIQKLLKKHNYRRRKAQKRQTMKAVPHRNEQFENIARLMTEYRASPNPMVSMDVKKKEYLGNFYRDGHLYTLAELVTYDHDFANFAQGVVIPHAIYDLKRNTGYINLGTSKDTTQFACDCFRNWWYNEGRFEYPHATSILVLCDGGGSNSSRYYIFKEDLQKLADEIGLEIRIAHYPPYCSKHNPIEHRLFPHVTRACQGVVFKTIALVKELMEKTSTSTGLKVTVQIIDKVYALKRKVADDFKDTMRIVFDDFLPQWNYTAVPYGTVI
jgi:hypothetical protein